MSLTFKLKMVLSVLCFFFKPASWHLLLYQYRSIHFDSHISKRHSLIKSRVPHAPFILWAPALPKVSVKPWQFFRLHVAFVPFWRLFSCCGSCGCACFSVQTKQLPLQKWMLLSWCIFTLLSHGDTQCIVCLLFPKRSFTTYMQAVIAYLLCTSHLLFPAI